MEHIAIMKKSWGLISKILSGEKTIESRWYSKRFVPWGKIHAGEVIYFKDSGGPIIARANVEKVEQYSALVPNKVRRILSKYGQKGGLGLEDIPKFIELFKNKKYCVLVFLRNAQKVEPFYINKSGFGIGSAWLSVEGVESLRRAS